MPRVLSHTPSWLSRPSPGFDVFSAPPHKTTPPLMRDAPAPSAPSRLIARRGTQIFVAVDNEVRWTDLMLLKDYEEQNGIGRKSVRISPDNVPESIYRVLKLGSGISGRICQLIVSPFGDYMAVVTSHTVHIVVFKGHNEYELDIEPSGLKTFHLGPSQHVLERAPLVSVLWHPLSPFGKCLITVTADAVVRLWELNHDNRITFQECEMSIDLGRLANAGSADESLSASEFGRGASFMPDSAYLQPTAAAFGGTGRVGENPWSAMTLWTVTQEGDMYALCPLLPSKFRASPGLVRNLWDSVSAKREELEGDESSDADLHQVKQQEEWLKNLEEVDLVTYDNPDGRLVDALTRPRRPDPVPHLQGPFELGIWEPKITEILVRNICLGEETIEFETGEMIEDEDDGDLVPLDNSIFLLMSEAGSVHVLIGLEGIEGRWFDGQIDADEPETSPIIHLVTFASHEPTSVVKRDFYPSLTADPMSQYAFFVNNICGVSHFSLEPWVERLRDELENPSDVGVDFRAELFAKNVKPSVDQLIRFPQHRAGKPSSEISGCLAIYDDDIGYMLLTCIHGEPMAVVLDTRHQELALNASTASLSQSTSRKVWNESQIADASYRQPIVRAPYAADNRLWELGDVGRFLKEFPSRAKIPLGRNYELSADTMDSFIQAHQAFSRESRQLSEAAAGIFLACDRMLNEYHDQLQSLREVANQIDAITGHDDEEVFSEDIQEAHGHEKLSRRIETAKDRQEDIMRRAKDVSKKLGKLGSGKQVSEKQQAFMNEVDSLAVQLGVAEKEQQNEDADNEDDEDFFGESEGSNLIQRIDEVKELAKELTEEAKKLPSQNGTASPRRQRVPASMRKEKMDQVKELLDMESSILEATTERLDRLSVQI